MKNISIILPVKGRVDAFYSLMNSLILNTKDLSKIEVLVACDMDDEVFCDLIDFLENKYRLISLKIYKRLNSNHFSRDYWNWLAEKSNARFIINVALGCKFETFWWDDIVYKKMSEYANIVGDDLIHGLIKDNIPRHGEDKEYPNFSCHPVLSKKHIEVLGYLFDERNVCWGCDQCVTIVYKELEKQLNQKRIVSLTDVYISADKDIHTTTQEDLNKLAKDIGVEANMPNTEFILKVLRITNSSYQKFLKLSQDNPYSMTKEDAIIEAKKLYNYIRRSG